MFDAVAVSDANLSRAESVGGVGVGGFSARAVRDGGVGVGGFALLGRGGNDNGFGMSNRGGGGTNDGVMVGGVVVLGVSTVFCLAASTLDLSPTGLCDFFRLDFPSCPVNTSGETTGGLGASFRFFMVDTMSGSKTRGFLVPSCVRVVLSVPSFRPTSVVRGGSSKA